MPYDADAIEAKCLEPLLIELFQEHYAPRCDVDTATSLARLQAGALCLFMGGARDLALRRRGDLYEKSAAAGVTRQNVHAADAQAFLELASLCRTRFRRSPRLLDARTTFLRHAVETFLPHMTERRREQETPRRDLPAKAA